MVCAGDVPTMGREGQGRESEEEGEAKMREEN